MDYQKELISQSLMVGFSIFFISLLDFLNVLLDSFDKMGSLFDVRKLASFWVLLLLLQNGYYVDLMDITSKIFHRSLCFGILWSNILLRLRIFGLNDAQQPIIVANPFQYVVFIVYDFQVYIQVILSYLLALFRPVWTLLLCKVQILPSSLFHV